MLEDAKNKVILNKEIDVVSKRVYYFLKSKM